MNDIAEKKVTQQAFEGTGVPALAIPCKMKITELRQKQYELRKKRTEFEKKLLGDSEYKQMIEEIKDLQKEKKAMKARLMARKDVFELNEKLGDLREEIKEIKADLNDVLGEYEQKTGRDTVEDMLGSPHRIVKTYKAIKVPSIPDNDQTVSVSVAT